MRDQNYSFSSLFQLITRFYKGRVGDAQVAAYAGVLTLKGIPPVLLVGDVQQVEVQQSSNRSEGMLFVLAPKVIY